MVHFAGDCQAVNSSASAVIRIRAGRVAWAVIRIRAGRVEATLGGMSEGVKTASATIHQLAKAMKKPAMKFPIRMDDH